MTRTAFGAGSPGSVSARFALAVMDLVHRSHRVKQSDLAVTFNAVVRPLGIEATVYVVDHEQRALHGLPEPGKPLREPVPIGGSLAGRVFTTVTAERGDGLHRLWVPMLDGTERLGVVEFLLPWGLTAEEPAVVEGCAGLTALVGHLVHAKSVHGDTIERVRRTQPMSVASELLWRMLPPLTFACDELVVSALLEPCYTVGGDGFDYAVDGSSAYLAIFDAAGHGLPAGLAGAVALSAMRTARREGQGLYVMARSADEALAAQWNGSSISMFVTAFLAELDLETGRLRYVNAGHPPPVVIRHGRAVAYLDHGRRMPLGLDDLEVVVAETHLEPGDRLLAYTDGITEARDAGDEMFGLARLVDLTVRQVASDLPTPEMLRRTVHAVLDHHRQHLQDDATLMLVEWSRAAAARTVASRPTADSPG